MTGFVCLCCGRTVAGGCAICPGCGQDNPAVHVRKAKKPPRKETAADKYGCLLVGLIIFAMIVFAAFYGVFDNP